MPPKKHSDIGASSAGRWLNCPGSVKLLQDVPRKDSIYAQSGTAQHYVAEKCLLENKDAIYFRGRKVNVKAQDGSLVGIEFTDEMVRAVQVYLDCVRGDQQDDGHAGTLAIEEKFHLEWLHEGLYGTNDASLGIPFGTLRVYDYKSGRRGVDPKENPQLTYYALGAIGKDNPNDYDKVQLVIVQPNGEGAAIKRWCTTVDAIFKWRDEVLLPGVKAALDPLAQPSAGPWCEKHFCDAMAVCPAVRAKANKTAQGLFSPVPVGGPAPALPAPQGMTDEQILLVLTNGDMVKSWIDEVFGFVTRKLELGEDPAGGAYKLVRGRSNRKYKEEAEKELAKVLKGKAYEEKLVGLTEAEKRLADVLGWEKPVIKEFMASITEKPEGKISLALATDSRPAVSAGHTFTAVAESTTEGSFDTIDINTLDWL